MFYYTIVFFILAAVTGLIGFMATVTMVAAVAKVLCFLFSMFFAMSVFFSGWRP